MPNPFNDHLDLRWQVHDCIDALADALGNLARAHDVRGNTAQANSVRDEANGMWTLFGPDFQEAVPDPRIHA